MWLHIDLDAEPRGFIHQQAGIADAAFAEMKVVADSDPADAETLDEIVVNEVLRRGAGASLVEGHDDGAGEAGSCQQAQFGGFVGEPELRRVRAEETARMRLEGYRQSACFMQFRHA